MSVTDPLYPSQWHFDFIGDIEAIWQDYTGDGVAVAVYDDGVESAHEDLAANYDQSLEFALDDGEPNSSTDGHGTSVAGIIGAANNGIGVVGIGYDVSITSVDYLNDIQYMSLDNQLAAFRHVANFDVMNNSWGSVPGYYSSLDVGDNTNHAFYYAEAFTDVVATGRGGLGTIITLAAGNEANDGTLTASGILGNAQGDGLNNLFQTITVAATNSSGTVASYSNYGENILIAAPAASYTADRTGSAGYSNDEYTSGFSGTSAATPVVSGVVSLVLDAAPGLGWRDVQNILAASASHVGSALGASASGDEVEAWGSNAATNWNGGGMTFNASYGYGMIDAFAAVRFAEIWHLMNASAATSANEQVVSASSTGGSVAINDNSTASKTISIAADIDIEHVYVTVDLTHTYSGDLTITLVSPDGDRIVLFDRELGSTDFTNDWTFGITSLRGTGSAGDWILEVQDSAGGDTGQLISVDLEFHGSTSSADTLWHFTDDFNALANDEGGRRTITDTDGGTDWLNFAGVTGDVTVSMESAGQISVDGTSWANLGNALIENLALGDGDDTAIGNDLDNHMIGGRGGDTLSGGAGDDLVNAEHVRADFDIVSSQVFRLFQATLDRAPNAGGHLDWVDQISSGSLTLESAASGFVNSAEFQATYGATTDGDFVTLLYQNVLDRTPAQAGYDYWVGLLDSGWSREQVVLGFSESQEFQDSTAGSSLVYSWAGYQGSWSDNIFRLFQATLDRAPAGAGMEHWTAYLANGATLLEAVTGFVESTEFQATYGATTNGEFVTLLYQNVLDRAPAQAGYDHWVGLLDSGAWSREEVVLGFSESLEFVTGTLSDMVAFMRGLGEHDRISGGSGDNMLFGGWRADTFVFNGSQTSTNAVSGFESWDWVELQQSGFASAAEALAALVQTADGVSLTTGDTSILFENTELNDFTEDMFILI